jgi:MFS family permease
LKENKSQRNFIGGLIHGVFLAMSVRLGDIELILPAFINAFTDSQYLIGFLASTYYGINYLTQPLFANFVEPKRRKKTYLYIAIFTRLASWFIIGLLTFVLGERHPWLIMGILLMLVAIYSTAGGLGGVAYTDIIGKVIAPDRRGRFFATIQMVGSLLAFAAGYIVNIVLGESFPLGFPYNYGVIFFLASATLLIGAVGFFVIVEPLQAQEGKREPLAAYLRKIPKILLQDRPFLIYNIVMALSGFHLMLIPFYIVFLRQIKEVPASYIGVYLMARVFGGAISNILWGWLGDWKGSNRVIQACLMLGFLTPTIALVLRNAAPIYYVIVFAMVGSAVSARKVGFNAYLIDVAPSDRRPTYTGINGVLISVMIPFPFVIGALIENFSFAVAFLTVAAILGGTLPLGFLLRRPEKEYAKEAAFQP